MRSYGYRFVKSWPGERIAAGADCRLTGGRGLALTESRNVVRGVSDKGGGCAAFFVFCIPLKEAVMAKPTTVKIKLVSTADTGFYYVTKKNPRNITEKMTFRKYDPVARKHVEFKEAKIK